MTPITATEFELQKSNNILRQRVYELEEKLRALRTQLTEVTKAAKPLIESGIFLHDIVDNEITVGYDYACANWLNALAEYELAQSAPAPVSILEGTWPAADIRRAFVAGAMWWEWKKENATMWQSDQNLVEKEADKRYPGVTTQLDVREAELRVVEAEREVIEHAKWWRQGVSRHSNVNWMGVNNLARAIDTLAALSADAPAPEAVGEA